MKLAIPDLISNSYFPAVAAAELGFFARRRARCLGRADLSGRPRLPGPARRRSRFRRRRGARRARRLSRMARRQTARRAVAGHVLVSRHARRSRHRARRPRGARGPTDRRRALGRDGAAAPARSPPASIRAATASASGRCPARPTRRSRQFRPDRGAGAGERRDRRVLGQRHGDRDGGDRAASARWCSTCGAATARPAASTTRCRCWRRPSGWSSARRTPPPRRCARWSRRRTR